MNSDAPVGFHPGLRLRPRCAQLGGCEDHPLAASRVGNSDRGCDMVGPKAGDEILDQSERYGLPRDLGKFFGASFDGDKALPVDRDNIARVV